MRSTILDMVSNSFKDLPNSEKVRLSENFIDGALGIVDSLLANTLSPEIARHQKMLDRNCIKGYNHKHDSTLPRGVCYLEEDTYKRIK